MTSVPNAFDRLYEFGWAAAEVLVPRLILALLVLGAGAIIARWVADAVSVALARTGSVDPTARPALVAAARYGVLVIAIVAALSQIGVQTASLLAALGAAGLAIGLALQGTLANIAAGIMLLWLRPFQVGDYIEIVSATPFAGKVREIGLFACQIETYDGLFLFAPNSTIWAVPLRNHSRNAGRLVSFNVGFAPGADLSRACAVLSDAIARQPGVLKAPPPEVFLANLNAGAPLATCRLWAAPDRVGAVQRAIVQDAHIALDEAGMQPTEVVRTIPPETDPSRLL
ncbi:mechanosensitive ion channel family protein [Roseiarcus sp.]|uniref:mechanosensitive ion channel family protein n=1 Tax=Roseiarcus sp. TaxID=1969460 RepID=UPI003F9D82A6